MFILNYIIFKFEDLYFFNKEFDIDNKYDNWNNVILNDMNQNDMQMIYILFVKYVLIFLEYM